MKLKNNTFFHRSFLAIVLTLFSLQLNGQIVFEENFNLPEGTTSGTADGVNWSSSCPTCLNGDHWEVKSGVFEGKDTNGEAVWATDTPIIFQHVKILKLVLTLTASEPWKDAEQTVTLLIGFAFNTILMAQVGLIQQTHTTVVELAQESM